MRSRRRLICLFVLLPIVSLGYGQQASAETATETTVASPTSATSPPGDTNTTSSAPTATTLSPPPTPPTAPPTPAAPPSSLTINFANALRYQWYPVTASGALCDTNATTGCSGGLGCLIKVAKEKNGDVKIPFISAGNVLNDPTNTTDFYKALKFGPAVKALNSLKDVGLKAVVMGEEMFRYGGSLARNLVKNVETTFTACNLNWTVTPDEKSFAPFVDILSDVSGFTCGIRVIGFAAKRTEQLHPENLKVTDELESIKKTIDSVKRDNKLLVVLGEGTKELAKQISTIADVDLVLISGSVITDGENFEKVSEGGRTKYLVYKEGPGGFFRIAANLTGDCSITDASVEFLNYDKGADCKTDSTTAKEAIDAGVSNYRSYLEEVSIKLLAPLRTADCPNRECTVGSLLADAVASAMAQQIANNATLGPRVVLLPSNIIANNVILNETVSQKYLLTTLLRDDEAIYNVNLTPAQLKQLFESMLATSSVNYPQISGFRLFIEKDIGKGTMVDLLQVLGDDLVFKNVRLEDEPYRVALPMSALLRNGIPNLDDLPHTVTDVFVSKALLLHLKALSPEGKFLVAPALGERITYVLPPSRSRCENLIALTVCYTFLSIITICGLLLLGYKIYVDRTAVHYVR